MKKEEKSWRKKREKINREKQITLWWNSFKFVCAWKLNTEPERERESERMEKKERKKNIMPDYLDTAPWQWHNLFPSRMYAWLRNHCEWYSLRSLSLQNRHIHIYILILILILVLVPYRFAATNHNRCLWIIWEQQQVNSKIRSNNKM